MKKIISLLLTAVLLTIATLTLFSCTRADNLPENRIQFEEKYFYCIRSNDNYKYYDKHYYIFHSDGTGELHSYFDSNGTISSGIAYFEWRTASDGAIHFFKTSSKLKSDNEDEHFNPSKGLWKASVSEDFIYNSNHYYIRENSEIFKLCTKAQQTISSPY